MTMKKCLPLFFLVCLSFLLAATENFVKNGNFEDGAVGWRLPAGAEVDRGFGFNGNGGLKLTRTAEMKYEYVSQPLDLVPGKLYTLAVQLRSEDVKPGLPNVGVEFYDASNKWLGGIYKSGPRDAEEWSWVEVNVSVPKEAAKCSLALYIQKGSTGTVWFDNVSVTAAEKIPAIQFVYPVQGILDAKRPLVRVNAGIMGNSMGLAAFSGMSVELMVMDAQGEGYFFQEPIKGHMAEFRLPALPEGKTDFRATLTGPDGVPIGESAERIVVAQNFEETERPQGSSIIDEYGRLIVDGQPFLPIGLYTTILEDLELIADSDYNCVLPYGSWTLNIEKSVTAGDADAMMRAMNALQDCNMKIIFSLKDFYDLPRYQDHVWAVRNAIGVKTTRELWETLVNRIKGHPALLAWYNNDEIPLKDQEKAEEMRLFLNQVDPNHPVLSVLCDFLETPFFGKSCDILAVDPYPITKEKVSNQRRTVEGVDAAQASGQPFWGVPQIFNWGMYHSRDNAKDFPNWIQPRPSQMRGITLLEALRGARGFIMYSYFDLKRGFVDPDRFGGEAVQTEADYWWHWQEAKELATMLKTLSPWLLSKQGPIALPLEVKSGKMEAAIFRTDDNGRPAVVAASIGPDNVDATLRLPPGIPPLKAIYGNAHEVEAGVWHFSGNDVWGEILVPKN